MTYKSLFDRIENYDEMDNFQIYDGSLGQVLNELEVSLTEPVNNPKAVDFNLGALITLVLHPPRVIRAVVDYKVQNPNERIEKLLRESIQLGLSVYESSKDSIQLLRTFRENVKETGNEQLLTTNLKQPHDTYTWRATSPKNSIASAYRLSNMTVGNRDLFFIALAHGGVAPGMDVYLRYCDLCGSKKSEFYVVRLSTDKLGDKQPQLTDSEIKYLQELSERRQVVIFDEDISTGETMRRASTFFSQKVFFNQIRMLTLANTGEIERLETKRSSLIECIVANEIEFSNPKKFPQYLI